VSCAASNFTVVEVDVDVSGATAVVEVVEVVVVSCAVRPEE
jgi:hypothetical protein